MFHLQPFKHYFTIFYIFGLYPYIPNANNDKNQIQSKFVQFLPRIANITVLILIISFLVYERTKSSMYLFLYVHAFLIYIIIVNLVAVVENMCNIHIIHHILQTMSSIMNSLAKSLQVQYPYKILKKSVERKFFIQMTVNILCFIIKFIIESMFERDWKRSSLWSLLYLIKCIHLIHLIFYVDFMTFALSSLSQTIITTMIGKNNHCLYNEDSNEYLHLVRQIKFIHFKLGHLSRCVNNLFGWFLVICAIETASTTVSTFFYAFWLITETGNLTLIPRKYNILLYIFFVR